MSRSFTPISVHGKKFDNTYIRRARQPFNDIRLYSTWSLLQERLVSEQKLSIQQLSFHTSEAARFYRFLNNPRVNTEEIIKMNCSIKPEVLQDREVLCIGDSTSFNLSKRSGRIKDSSSLGVLQDGKTAGFFAHTHLALDAQSGSILGLADVLYWTRAKDSKPSKKSTPTQDKESYKWFMGAANAQKALNSARRISYVLDSEADNFELLHYLQNELEADFIIRSHHNRKVRVEDQELLLDACLEQSPLRASYQLDLPALNHYSWTSGKRIQRTARQATIEVRFEALQVKSPKGSKTSTPLQLYIVEAKEVTSGLPKGEGPVCWRLWTTHQVDNAQTARSIIGYYLLRWIIEQLFRAMKKKGFNQEATELESVDAILKQTTMTFKAAAKVLQLVYARDQSNEQPIEQVFDQEEQKVLHKVNERLQGKTEKQKNPFPDHQLNWATWVIARLGGWKGYASHKPPGPLTIKRGLDKFSGIFEGYRIFNSS